MAFGGIRSLERAAQTTNEWIDELDGAFGWSDRQRTYQSFRAVVHALRDRLRVDEAVQLAAQLPTILRGAYYDGWNPSKTPVAIRSQQEFIERVVEEYGAPNISTPSEMISVVFGLLQRRISDGEIEDVKASLPEELVAMWPDA